MAKASSEVLKQAGLLPRLVLAVKKEGGGVESTGIHKVTFVEDKIVKGTDYETKEQIAEMKYVFEEDGVQKEYRVPVKNKNGEVHYFVQRMAEIEEGTELKLECKSRGMTKFIEITTDKQPEVISSVGDDDIPVIEDEPFAQDTVDGEPIKKVDQSQIPF